LATDNTDGQARKVTRQSRERDDLRPRHLGMTVLEGLGHAAGGLSNYPRVVDHPHLEHLVTLKGIDAIRDPFSDFRDGLQDAAQAIRVAPGWKA